MCPLASDVISNVPVYDVPPLDADTLADRWINVKALMAEWADVLTESRRRRGAASKPTTDLSVIDEASEIFLNLIRAREGEQQQQRRSLCGGRQ